MKNPIASLQLLALSFLLPSALSAHPGHPHPEWDVDEFEELASGFLGGAAHPLSGIDHLLVALVAGAIVVAAPRKRGRWLSVAFFGSLALGFVAGASVIPPALIGMAAGFGLAASGILALVRPATAVEPLLLAAMGFCQGTAHGMSGFSGAAGAGLLVGTACAAGIGAFGFAALRGTHQRARRSHRAAP